MIMGRGGMRARGKGGRGKGGGGGGGKDSKYAPKKKKKKKREKGGCCSMRNFLLVKMTNYDVTNPATMTPLTPLL